MASGRRHNRGSYAISEVTTARKQVEGRQALLLELACRLRTTPDETMDAAAAVLGRHLSVVESVTANLM